METADLYLLIGGLAIALIVLLVLAYCIKRKCCSRSPQDQFDSPFVPSSPPPPTWQHSRSEHFVGSVGTSGRYRPSYAEVSGYRVENERSRPRPYEPAINWMRPAPVSPQHNEYTGYYIGSHQRVQRPIGLARVPQDASAGAANRWARPTPIKPPPPPKAKKLDDHDRDINEMILTMQGNLREDSSPEETIYNVQKLLLLCTADKSLISEDCRLIIGVDATPAAQAGYCVNLKEKRLNYYVIKRDDLPWVLHEPKDPSEFEMKNFMFALTVWQEEILKGKRIRIYTDNFAITKAKCFDDNKYGERAFKVLCHYTNCKSIKVLNINNMAINRFKNLKNFAKFIQPADDLSRWRITEAIKFLTEFYGIDQENVQGTHCLDKGHNRNRHIADPGKAWYKPTERYQQVLRYAKNKINLHDCHNPTCSGTDLLQASLRRSK